MQQKAGNSQLKCAMNWTLVALVVCIRAPAGRAPECFEDGMVLDRYTASLVGPIEAVLTVKTLAGNFPVNCSSLSNSSSVGVPGEFQFAPHRPTVAHLHAAH